MKKIDKGEMILIAFVLLEMIWAAIMIYKPTLAAEAKEGITITKDAEPILTLNEPAKLKVVNINVNVSEAVKPELKLDYGDKELIARLINAEAKGEDMIGKRLIADVILNRVENEGFPDEVSSVIYEAKQFTKPSAGFTDEDMEAVELELYKRLDRDVVYFRTGRFHDIGKRLYQHGRHFFSGKDTE